MIGLTRGNELAKAPEGSFAVMLSRLTKWAVPALFGVVLWAAPSNASPILPGNANPYLLAAESSDIANPAQGANFTDGVAFNHHEVADLRSNSSRAALPPAAILFGSALLGLTLLKRRRSRRATESAGA